jgi:hypothetical protein
MTVTELMDAAALVPGLMARITALERKVAELSPATGKKWLTLAEAARELRCSTKSVSRLIAVGKLRRNIESYRVRILAEDVEAYASRVTLPLR